MSLLTKLKNFFKNRAKMVKSGEEVSLVDYALAIISGAAIGYGLYKLIYGRKEHYECPNCHNIFAGKPHNCPYCNDIFIW